MLRNSLNRIYRLKILVLGLTFLILSILLSLTADWLTSTDAPHQIVAIINTLADVLLVTGAIGLAVDFFAGRDKDAADTERTRSVLKELTPDFTEAVLKGLAVDKSDLERLASPELLDDIATNALSLRLGDDQFAREIYADIRDQAIRAPERWYDVDVSIRLSSLEESNPEGAPRFDVLVKWEYTVVPSHPVQKFACFSDRQALRELIEETPSLIPWFMTPRPGFDARERAGFELLDFRIDGDQRAISRASRKHGQIYSARIGDDVLAAGKPVRMLCLPGAHAAERPPTVLRDHATNTRSGPHLRLHRYGHRAPECHRPRDQCAASSSCRTATAGGSPDSVCPGAELASTPRGVRLRVDARQRAVQRRRSRRAHELRTCEGRSLTGMSGSIQSPPPMSTPRNPRNIWRDQQCQIFRADGTSLRWKRGRRVPRARPDDLGGVRPRPRSSPAATPP